MGDGLSGQVHGLSRQGAWRYVWLSVAVCVLHVCHAPL